MNDNCFLIQDTMKEKDELSKVNLEYTLPYHEFGIKVDDIQCQDIAKQVKKFYFGFSDLSVDTLPVYLMVTEFGLFIFFRIISFVLHTIIQIKIVDLKCDSTIFYSH